MFQPGQWYDLCLGKQLWSCLSNGLENKNGRKQISLSAIPIDHQREDGDLNLSRNA